MKTAMEILADPFAAGLTSVLTTLWFSAVAAVRSLKLQFKRSVGGFSLVAIS